MMTKGYRKLPRFAWFVLVILMTVSSSGWADIPPERRAMLEAMRDSVRESGMVIPVGEEHGYQELLVVEVDAAGEIHKKSVLPVRFVPLTGDR